MAIVRGNITTASTRYLQDLWFENNVAVGADALLVVLAFQATMREENHLIPPSGLFLTDVTYSGFELTYTGSFQTNTFDGSDPYVAAYYITSPITGTNPIQISTNSGVQDMYAVAIDYQGVDGSNPIEAVPTFAATDIPNFQLGGAGIFTTSSGSTIVSVTLCPASGPGEHVHGDGQVTLFDVQEGGSRFSGSELVVTATGIYTTMITTNLGEKISPSLTVPLRPA